ncbi:hypothetical protein HMI56_003107 [Coelomomyces lativittatus]|nr:hypothetical protein HMI56_003107 [Coelomomyces lativittatus]
MLGQDRQGTIFTVALTGGPAGGKTTVQSMLSDVLENLGYKGRSHVSSRNRGCKDCLPRFTFLKKFFSFFDVHFPSCGNFLSFFYF